MQQNTDPYRVEAVDRALILLDLVRSRRQLSVTEAASELHVAPSTAHRLLSTLCGRGYVAQGARRRYYPGPKLERARGDGLRLLVGRMRPHLQTLFDQVGETVHLMALVGSDVLFLDGIEATQSLRIGLRIGSRMPAYTTSGGKAILAELADDAVAILHPDGLPPWPGPHVADLSGLLDELDAVRKRRFGANAENSEPGVTAIGAALARVDGEPAAALSVALPTARFSTTVEDGIVDKLLAVCASATPAD